MDGDHEYLQQEQHRSYSQSSLVPFFYDTTCVDKQQS